MLAREKKTRANRTAVPDPLVQVGLDPNVLGEHELGDELAHLVKCVRAHDGFVNIQIISKSRIRK